MGICVGALQKPSISSAAVTNSWDLRMICRLSSWEKYEKIQNIRRTIFKLRRAVEYRDMDQRPDNLFPITLFVHIFWLGRFRTPSYVGIIFSIFIERNFFSVASFFVWFLADVSEAASECVRHQQITLDIKVPSQWFKYLHTEGIPGRWELSELCDSIEENLGRKCSEWGEKASDWICHNSRKKKSIMK